MKRRHLKPGTVAGLSGEHLGCQIGVNGVGYWLSSVIHRRRVVEVSATWLEDAADGAEEWVKGVRQFARETRCTVWSWEKWFPLTMGEQLLACRYFDHVIAPTMGISEQELDDNVAAVRDARAAYVDAVNDDRALLLKLQAWNVETNRRRLLDGN